MRTESEKNEGLKTNIFVFYSLRAKNIFMLMQKNKKYLPPCNLMHFLSLVIIETYQYIKII
jgi:hypothetical protein